MDDAFPTTLDLPCTPCLLETTFAILDVETTGASHRFGDRLTEIAVIRVERGAVVERWSTLLNPGRPIPRFITEITGIDDAMVADAPGFGTVWPELQRVVRGASVMGHNVMFDLGFVGAELGRCDVCLAEMLGEHPVFDTVRIARKLYGRGGNGLQNLARRLDCVPSTAHRALADVETTLAVFERMLHPLGGWSMPLADLRKLQGRPVRVAPLASRAA